MIKFSLLFALLLAEMAGNGISFAQDNSNISVNSNIELLFAMQMQSQMDSIIISKGFAAFPLTTQLNFQLKKDYQNTFIKYKSSAQIEYYNTLIPKGFIFSAPFYAVLMTDSSLNIRNRCWLNNLPFPQSAKDSILLFIEKLKGFRDLTGFNDFYQSNRPIYESMIKQQEDKVSLNKLIGSIEKYFGWNLPGYHVVLVPMMWPGGISLEYKEHCSDTIAQVYVYIGPKHVGTDIPDFGTKDEYKSVVLHEIIHPFIMYYCNKYRDQTEKYSGHYLRNKTVYQNNALPDWFSAVNEELTRTAEIIINSGNDKEKAKKDIDYQSNELGFQYIAAWYGCFEKYYGSDSRGLVSLDAVFKDILASFDELSRNIK